METLDVNFRLFVAFDMRLFFPLPVPEMTSVLNYGGLNYQIGNPIRYEITKVNTAVSDLKKVVDNNAADILLVKAKSSEITELRGQVADLKSQVTLLEKMCRDLMATVATLKS
jgi:archaellum component FlaC